MNMSFEELVKSTQSQIQVYRYQRETDSYKDTPQFILNLPVAPKELYRNYFKDIVLGQAVGIYMGVEQLKHLVVRPTLLVREDAKHWTFIHEYTHHLFNEARKTLRQNLPEGYLTKYQDHTETLQESFQRLEKNNFHFKDQAHLEEYLICLKVALDIRIKMLLQFELEEIAVESMIRNFYAKQKNANFDEEYYENSDTYIQNNLKRTANSIDGFITFIEVVLPVLKKQDSDAIFLKSYRKKLVDLKTEIRNFK